MPTFAGTIVNNQIILVSAVSLPGSASTHKSYKSLLDTGAQGTLISPNIVDEIGLSPIGPAFITVANGQTIETTKHRIRLDIPISSVDPKSSGEVKPEVTFRGMDMDVAKLPYQPDNHDVLLGMNFLSAFHLTIHGSVFILSI